MTGKKVPREKLEVTHYQLLFLVHLEAEHEPSAIDHQPSAGRNSDDLKPRGAADRSKLPSLIPKDLFRASLQAKV